MEPIRADALPSDIVLGPFHERQRALGATFYEDYGRLWVASFGDPVAEYWAVRRDAGLWDTSALVTFHVTGRDTLAALDRIFTRQLRDARPGLVRYGMVLNEKGLMLDEATVVVLSSEEAYLFGNDGGREFTEHMVANTQQMDVRFRNVSAAIPSLAVQGPGSYEVLSQLTATDITSLRWFRCLTEPIEIAGVSCLLVRAGFTGELGYELYLIDGHDGAERVWDAVIGAGATPIGLDAIEMLRIEAGLLIAEEDYFPGLTDPIDLGMERFIDFDGTDFVGKAAARAQAGQPRRRFVTLELGGDEVPAHATPVTSGGTVVGDVRSSERTPRFGTLALAVVDINFSEPGTELVVGDQVGRVSPVPIDDPMKLRPRSDPLNPVTATSAPWLPDRPRIR